jgi:hypothetical protein
MKSEREPPSLGFEQFIPCIVHAFSSRYGSASSPTFVSAFPTPLPEPQVRTSISLRARADALLVCAVHCALTQISDETVTVMRVDGLQVETLICSREDRSLWRGDVRGPRVGRESGGAANSVHLVGGQGSVVLLFQNKGIRNADHAAVVDATRRTAGSRSAHYSRSVRQLCLDTAGTSTCWS